jgi:chemotaxis protein methyltransferase CheR
VTTVLLEPAGLERFRLIVERRFGLQHDDSKLEQLADVVRSRLAATRSPSLPSYLELLQSRGSDELRVLAEQLTVNETFFFRNNDNFRALAELVIPERIAERSPDKRLRILSAGCASGEEPYSLAIVLRESIPDFASWTFDIIAVDLNAAVLARAAQARFSRWSLRATPNEVQERYFQPHGTDFLLAREIRNMVRFEERNLVDDDCTFWHSLACDVVFCRNVLMYFTPESARAVVQRITRALLPRGYLFLGHAETLRGLSQDFHLCHSHETFYYRRCDESEVGRMIRSAPATRSASEVAISAVLDTGAPWVDAIQRASERIAALAGNRPRSASGPESDSTAAHDSRPALAWQAWDLGLVLEAMRQERFAEALTLLSALPPESQLDVDALLLRAVLLTNTGALHESEQVCRNLLALDELSAGAHYLMALCRERAGDRSPFTSIRALQCRIFTSASWPSAEGIW